MYLEVDEIWVMNPYAPSPSLNDDRLVHLTKAFKHPPLSWKQLLSRSVFLIVCGHI